MHWIEDHPTLTVSLGALALLLIAGAVMVLLASQEARTFNKLTHRSDVTTWDALWVNLRVDCTPVP